jgi:hypothetical protein
MARRQVKKPAAELPSAADLDMLRQLLPGWSGVYAEEEFRSLLQMWFRYAMRPEPPGEATHVGPELRRIALAAQELRDALREGPSGRREIARDVDAQVEQAEQEKKHGYEPSELWPMSKLETAVRYLARGTERTEQRWQRERKRFRGKRRRELQALEALCEIFQDASGCKATVSKHKGDGRLQGDWWEFAHEAVLLAWPDRQKVPTELIASAARNVRAKELERKKELGRLRKELKRRREELER